MGCAQSVGQSNQVRPITVEQKIAGTPQKSRYQGWTDSGSPDGHRVTALTAVSDGEDAAATTLPRPVSLESDRHPSLSAACAITHEPEVRGSGSGKGGRGRGGMGASNGASVKGKGAGKGKVGPERSGAGKGGRAPPPPPPLPAAGGGAATTGASDSKRQSARRQRGGPQLPAQLLSGRAVSFDESDAAVPPHHRLACIAGRELLMRGRALKRLASARASLEYWQDVRFDFAGAAQQPRQPAPTLSGFAAPPLREWIGLRNNDSVALRISCAEYRFSVCFYLACCCRCGGTRCEG